MTIRLNSFTIATSLTPGDVLYLSQGGVEKQISAALLQESLFTALALPSGSSLIGCTQLGSGALARTVQSKLYDMSSVADFYANGAVLTSTWNPVAGSYYQSSNYTLNSSLSNTFQISVPGGTDVVGGNFSTLGLVNFNLVAGNGIYIAAARVRGGTAMGFNINTTGTTSAVRIIGNDVAVTGYGLLTNSSATIVDGMAVVGNCINSSTADAVEINAVTSAHSSISVIGNVLTADAAGSNVGSGFAVGVAGGFGNAFVGNAIRRARNEAFHFEETQYGNVVLGNSALNVGPYGLWTNNGAGDGVVFVGNYMKASAGNTGIGLYLVYDLNGGTPHMQMIGNRVVGFQTGISTSSADLIADKNVVKGATIGIDLVGGGNVIGENYISGATTLMHADNGAIVGKVYSDNNPVICDTSAISPQHIGVTSKGFRIVPGPFATVGGGVGAPLNYFNLFTLPTAMKARVMTRMQASGATGGYLYFSADVLWNGSTLSVTNPLVVSQNTIATSGVGYVLSGTTLQICVYAESVMSLGTTVDVDGECYFHA